MVQGPKGKESKAEERGKFSKRGKCEKKKHKQMKMFLIDKNASRIDQFHKLDVKLISSHDYSLWSLDFDRSFPSTASRHLASNWDMSDSDEYTTAIEEQFDIQRSVPQLYTIGKLHYSYHFSMGPNGKQPLHVENSSVPLRQF